MVQVRKLVLAIAAATALSSGLAQALELGELTLKSAANQPLVAEIELRDVAALTAPEIVPGLASPEEFARAGLDRQAFLNQLSFTPVINPGGRSVIQVTSSAPLNEPLLKFLVQVIYPSGRLMRDYSVLVDASKFSPPAADTAQAPAATPPVTAPSSAGTKEYTTTNRDTLWEIAARFRQEASVQQTMLAIQALNPAAFQDSNINRLRAGQVLRLPDNNDATALAQPQAVAEVARQNAAWREGRRLGPRAQQLDATRRNGNGTAPAPAQRDNLRLVSGEAANERAKGLAGDNKVLTDKLAVTQESLDTARRENGELKSRLTDLQSQLDKAQRLLQLKSDQLARLEAGAAAAPTAAAPNAVQPSAPVEGPPPGGEQPAINAQLTPPPEGQAAPATAPAPTQAGNDPAASLPAVQALPNEREQASNPWVLGGAGGLAVAVVLLAAWLLARRRKAQQESERHLRMAKELSEAQELRADDFDLPATSFDGLGTAAPSVRLAPAMVAASAAAATAATAPVYERPSRPAPRDELPSVASLVVAPAADDPLTQAEEHIARGRYSRASDVLEAAIEAEPERSDLRLKLMEVYGHQGDRDGFVAQERRLMASGANHARVDELKTRFPAMAGLAAGLSAAAVAAELDAQYVKDLLLDEADAPEPIGDVFDTDFDLSLDGIETTPEEPAAAPPPAAPTRSVPRDELDFEALLRESTVEQASTDPDLDLDLEPAEPTPSPVDDLDDLDPLDPEQGPEEAPDDTALPGDRERLDDFDLSLSEEQQDDQDRFAADVHDVNSQLDQLSRSLSQASANNSLHSANGMGEALDEFDFLADSDEVTTKLDLARAYIEMADADGARDILDEVLKEGTMAQQKEARKMLAALS
ncbi:FimV/HubP family polar landmark protein [Pseudomonas sp. RIT-PI-S]|uniref:FimV/HubP family polar landmark protein n=1 Tax=Pseudomonas sp. RIT-PI-S TaxID=3035295 RepID=UPI0021D7F697|nr:FimV/HubP family polar landmark protein [Pseudomonas sp. RIT-PI-S]